MSECEKSANGEHEPDFERAVYSRHVGLHCAVFRVECLHCKADGEMAVDSREVDWPVADGE